MIPSKYQQDVYDFVKNKKESLQIEAVAGSGKTTTIVEAAGLLEGSGQFVAFNRDIANSLKSKLPSHVSAKTLNGLGWGTCLANALIQPQLDPQKTQKILSGLLDFSNGEDKKFYYKNKGNINRLVSLFKANLIRVNEISDRIIDSYALNFELELPEGQELSKFKVLLQAVYGKSLRLTEIMDFDDQVCMPIFLNMSIRKSPYLMVDEGQDLNPANIELVLRAGSRIISVGDPNQSIYAFRGADIYAMQKLQDATNATKLPLSICYRCAKAIVRNAQKTVPQIEPWEGSPEGIVDSVKKDKYKTMVKDGDFILCRINAPLISACLSFIREGRKATIKGRNVGEQLVSLIDKLTRSNDRIPAEEFYQTLRAYELAEIERLTKTEKEDWIEVLQDKVACINTILEDSENVGEIKQKINKIFEENPSGGIILSSGHRAKGLEADRVFVLEPQLLGKPRKKPETTKQEKNVKYVVDTRAKLEHYYVDSK